MDGKGNKIKIRLTRERLEGLTNICDDMLEQYKPENETEMLMYVYLKDLTFSLHKKVAQNQGIYTVNMTMTEATAFKHLWNVLCIQHNKYASILVQTVLSKIAREQGAYIIS